MGDFNFRNQMKIEEVNLKIQKYLKSDEKMKIQILKDLKS